MEKKFIVKSVILDNTNNKELERYVGKSYKVLREFSTRIEVEHEGKPLMIPKENCVFYATLIKPTGNRDIDKNLNGEELLIYFEGTKLMTPIKTGEKDFEVFEIPRENLE